MKLPAAVDRIDRALLIRHFAITAAALAAYFLRFELRAGNGVLWVLGTAAILNLCAFFLSNSPRVGAFARQLSPFVAVTCWAALVHLTGGVSSPFAAGFWIEIALSAMSASPATISLVTCGAVVALWVQQATLGLAGATTSLMVQTGFLLLLGGVTLLLARRSIRAQRAHFQQRIDLERRLRALEKELSDVRLVGKVGENVAQLAHGLKNAVHSLRGFASLIEPRIAGQETGGAALEGLRNAIDRLEDLARFSLRAGDVPRLLVPPGDGRQARETIDEVAREMSVAYPEISWEKPADADVPPVTTSSAVLREVLLILLHNAAEAMGGRGRVRIETRASGDSLRIQVRDQGCGMTTEQIQRIFDPGYTTKPDGSGFGLYLARKLLEAQGGKLAAEPAPGGGALFSLALPVRGA